VGDIAAGAAPLVVQDFAASAQYHGARPETGGGAFASLCGVPVLRGGRLRGVLAVQNRRPRAYGSETVEVLQTVAMIVGELIVSGGLVSLLEMSSGDAAGGRTNHVEGVSLGRGLAVGTAVLYDPGLGIHDIVAEDAR